MNSTTSARPGRVVPSRPASLETGMARPAVTIAITGLPLSFSASTSAYCSSGRPGIEPRGRLAAHVAGLAEHDHHGIHLRGGLHRGGDLLGRDAVRPPSARSAPDPRRTRPACRRRRVTTSCGRPCALHSPSIAWRFSASGPVTRIRASSASGSRSPGSVSRTTASRPSCLAIARCSGLSQTSDLLGPAVAQPILVEAQRLLQAQHLDHPRLPPPRG